MRRLRPRIVVRRNSVNQSSRDGQSIRAIVLHSTEGDNVRGKADLASVAAWFDDPAARASSHVITDADGHSARCVPDSRKAWTCAAYNAATLNIEQVGHASQGRWDDEEVKETARWIAQWSLRHGIPIRKGRVAFGRVIRKGIVTHSQLGSAGGGHSDPGDSYPLKRVRRLAREIKRKRKDRRK